MKKDIRLLIIIPFFLIFNGCVSKKEVVDPIKELPNSIQNNFGTDILPNKEVAIKVCEIILLERYKNVDFNNYKPFIIESISEDRVWYIRAVQKDNPQRKHVYNIKINKNTGEVYNIWVDR